MWKKGRSQGWIQLFLCLSHQKAQITTNVGRKDYGWVHFWGGRSVPCVHWGRTQKIGTSLNTMLLGDVTLPLLLSGGEGYFSSPWVWKDFVTHRMWQKWHHMTSNPSLKRPCCFLLLLPWKAALRLPCKEFWSSLLEDGRPRRAGTITPVRPSRSASQPQASTTRYGVETSYTTQPSWVFKGFIMSVHFVILFVLLQYCCQVWWYAKIGFPCPLASD